MTYRVMLLPVGRRFRGFAPGLAGLLVAGGDRTGCAREHPRDDSRISGGGNRTYAGTGCPRGRSSSQLMGKLDGLGAGVRLLVGVIAGAHQRAGLHVAEAHLQRFFFQEAKLIRRVQPRHRQVVFRRPQILADGEDVDFPRGQIAKYCEQLVRALAQTRPSRRS